MNEFKIITIMNEAMIKTLKDKNYNYEANLKIEEQLKDETLFFKINKIDAYEILSKVGVKPEQLENVYTKLTSSDVFYDLLNKNKIKADDDNLTIKYNVYRL